MDWQERRQGNSIRISPTQVETFELCNRKWWLAKVRGLDPGAPSRSQVLGTVLHGVCERYLLADNHGRDPVTGREVDLYPEGWHIARNKYTGEIDGEAGVAEQDLIRRLIGKAIEEGILERQPYREIEKPFEIPVAEVDGVSVAMVGFIDVAYPDQIQDHKTSKSKRYVKSRDSLRENFQILVYAKVILEEARRKGIPPPERVILRHNQFILDPQNPEVRKVEVSVSATYVEEVWEGRAVRNAREMVRLRREVEAWHQVPDPPKGISACNAFGGCPYISICAGRESEKSFENKLDRIAQFRNNTAVTVNGKPVGRIEKQSTGDSSMSLQEKLAQRRALANAASKEAVPASKPTVNPPVVNQSPKSAAQAPPPAPATGAEQPVRPQRSPGAFSSREIGVAADGTPIVLPPWVVLDNPAQVNDGLGFNANGSPCAVSNMRAKKAGQPTSDQFEIEPVGDGTVVVVHRETGDEYRCALSLDAISQEVKSAELVEMPADKPTPQELWGGASEDAEASDESESESEPESESESDEEQGSEEESVVPSVNTLRGRGRPKTGFTLYVNCIPTQSSGRPGAREPLNLQVVLNEIGANMAAANGVSSFWELQAFSRRDEIMKLGEAIASRLNEKKAHVFAVVGSGQSDIRTLVEAIEPYAGSVVRALQL